MATSSSWRKALGAPEKGALASLAVWFASSYSSSATALQVLAGLAALILVPWAALRVGTRLLRPLIWRLRNRLLVAFLFIAVIPIGLVLAFVSLGSYLLAGQVATYLVYSRLDAHLSTLQNQASLIGRAGSPAAERTRGIVEDTYPGAQILVEPGRQDSGHGLTRKDGVLHGWARASRNGSATTILAPLSRTFVAGLDPDLGAVSLLARPGTFRLNAPPVAGEIAAAEVGVVPPPVNVLDAEVSWGTPLHVDAWGSESEPGDVALGVRTRLSAILTRLSSPGAEAARTLLIALYVVSVLILIAEFVSLFVGFSITRTLTAAVHNLYEGTQRVMQGDFTHRIPVTGSEQIADLSRSFNAMTENVERLLKVSKENERMQAELDIARRVQQQLFPTSTPHSETLELLAVCQPARQVSGDYYDYQALSEGKVVLALGDVAGKGISAALLMASLQSALRVQLREWQSNASGVSTQRLVTGLNEHLFLNTTPEKYATFFLAIYDEATGILEYTNAGHLPPLLVRGGTVTRLDSNGMVVGAFAGSPYDSSHLQLVPGDLLVCYTDGVTELEDEFAEQFGEERLSAVLLRCQGATLSEVESAILNATAQFSGSARRAEDPVAAQDDLTMLMLKRK